MPQKFTTKPIDEATPDELRAYAQQFLGIMCDGVLDKEVTARVRAANDGPTIYVEVPSEDEPHSQAGSPPPPSEDQEDRAALVGSLGRDDPRVQITIHAEERDGLVIARHKEVGVNGVVWALARGQSINIPYRVYLALENAERDSIVHNGDGVPISTKAKNTPYNVEVMPTKAEIADWHARTDNELMP